MHEAEGRAQGLSYVYRLLDTDTMGETAPPLADLVAFAEHFGFTGFNVTFPYKQEIIPLLDELSRGGRDAWLGQHGRAARGRRIGHNTDMWGFKESFRRGMAGARREQVLLLGAGGAGAAVAHALLESGVGKLLIADIEPIEADALAARLASRFGGAQRSRSSTDLAAAAAARRRHRQRDAGRHGEAARHADRRRSAAAGMLGRRHRLFPARDGAAPRGAAARLPHARAARAWRCSRRCGPSSCSPASRPTSIG